MKLQEYYLLLKSEESSFPLQNLTNHRMPTAFGFANNFLVVTLVTATIRSESYYKSRQSFARI